MYFANAEHKENYDCLMGMYELTRGEDVQYESNIYIAAYPEIFKCLDINMIKTSSDYCLWLQNGMRKKANMLSVQQL